MSKVALTLLLLLSAHAWAGENSNQAEYTINVHVGSSNLYPVAGFYGQQLSVTIEGNKYELQSGKVLDGLLALGDYKAKLVNDEHKTTYDSIRGYEFLFADKKTRRFLVVGQTE
jgi:hypothetical protein